MRTEFAGLVAGGGAFFEPFLLFFWLRGPGMVSAFERSWHKDQRELNRWRCGRCRGRGRGRPQRCRQRDARRCRDQGASAGVGADASVTVTLANRHQLQGANQLTNTAITFLQPPTVKVERLHGSQNGGVRLSITLLLCVTSQARLDFQSQDWHMHCR